MGSQTRDRRLLETGKDGILILDADTGHVAAVNAPLVEMLGYGHKTFIGKKLWEIDAFKQNGKFLKKAFSELQAEGDFFCEDLRLQSRGGRLIDAEFVGKACLLDQKNVIQCNIRVIAKRKRTQETLQQAHDELEERVRELTAGLESAKEHLSAFETAMKDRLVFEQLLSEVSSRVVNLPPDQLDLEIEHALKKVLDFFRVDRCGLVKVLPNKNSWLITHVAVAEDAPPIPLPKGVELPISIRLCAYDKLVRKREVFSLSSLDEVPAEAYADRQSYAECGIRSLLNIPIVIDGQVVHIIALNSVNTERVWPEEFIPRLRLLGEIFVNALESRQDRLRLEEQSRFEMLLVEISSRFVNLSAEEVDGEIEDAQRRVCDCLELDLSALWQWSVETPRILTLTHLSRSLEEPLPKPMYAHEYFPWCQQQLEAGKTVIVSSMDDLPSEAVRDKEVWQHFGVKTTLTLPLSFGENPPVGALSFNTVQAERTWPEPLVKRLQLVAQIFTNALIRKQNEIMLRESKARLSMITEAVSAGLWIMDVDTKKVWASPKCRELFQFAPDEEIFYEHFFRTIHPEDRDRIHQDVQQALQSGEELRCDYRIILPDGNTRWIGARGQRHLKSNGGPDRLLGLSLDITERKALELQLSESQALLASLVNSTSDLIWSVDSERFGLLTFNRGLSEYFLHNHRIHIKTGMRPEDMLPADYAQQWHKFYRRALGEGSFTTEYSTSGGNRVLRLNINCLRRGERVYGASVFGQDITGQKQLEEQLRRSLEEVGQLRDRLQTENLYLREEVKLLYKHTEIVGASKAIRSVLARAEQVSATDSTVLVLGETGTGKELLAHAIHNMSNRKNRALVTVNCASLPPTLIESELFGREKGAYTGSLTKMIGRFEIADGSTLFLDEIGDLPLELQSKLLRVLEQGQFERLGSSKTIKVNVRVIAATNRDLAREISEGRFRKDLFYRLNVFPITIPPLRDRKEDIPSLVWSFVKKFEKSMGRRIDSVPKKNMEALQNYPWPGNIRELKNVIEHAMILNSTRILNIEPPAQDPQEPPESHTLEDMERGHILDALKRTSWRISGKNSASEILGMKRTTLQSKIKKLGIYRSR